MEIAELPIIYRPHICGMIDGRAGLESSPHYLDPTGYLRINCLSVAETEAYETGYVLGQNQRNR